MTVEIAAARRTVIDLGADATILDAARSIAAVESPDIVLVVPSGAPVTRNAVFLEALRRRAGDRRIVLVSPEARARQGGAVVFVCEKDLRAERLQQTDLSNGAQPRSRSQIRSRPSRCAGSRRRPDCLLLR